VVEDDVTEKGTHGEGSEKIKGNMYKETTQKTQGFQDKCINIDVTSVLVYQY
jgi:hypothetical protein